jgi:hypothetical protein
MGAQCLRAVLLAAIGAAACGGSDYQSWYDGDPNRFVPWMPGSGPDASSGTGTGSGSGSASGSGSGSVLPQDAGVGAAFDAGAPGQADSGNAAPVEGGSGSPGPVTVFFVLMARQSWSAIAGSPSAPYINGTLLPMGAHAESYRAAPPQFAYSLANVVWLEAGDGLGIPGNRPPSQASSATTDHLANQLEAAGISWKAYVEGILPGECPIQDRYPYRTWHLPFVYFDDIIENPPSASSRRCTDHVVPFGDLAQDLQSGATPRYAFIVPDMCNDMHDDCNTGDRVRQGDDWLAANIPALLSSQAFANGAVVLIGWDYSPDGYVPIGLIALSAKAKPGYGCGAQLTPSSTLRTLQELFGVSPLLGDATNSADLSDLFLQFP